MPDTGFLFLSLGGVGAGMMFFLFPKPLQKLSGALDRTVTRLDEHLMQYRYVIGVVLFALSYGLFKLALWLPALRG